MTVATPRVLLISESRITRRVVEMTFADQQVDLVTVGSGEEGLAAWDDAPAAVVLADLSMNAPPDGLTVARHVHAHAGDRPVAVLLLAGQNDAVDDAEMAAAGVCAVLRKPLDSVQLIDAVRAAMRPGRTAVAPVHAEAAVAGTTDAAPVAETVARGPLGDEDLERVAARVAAIWGGDHDRERRVTELLAGRAEQAAAASATAAAERAAPAATSAAAERLVRELAPALVAEVARLVVADVSERLVREEIARMRAAGSAR